MNKNEKTHDAARSSAVEARFEAVEIFGHPALFSNGREQEAALPDGLLCYDLRGSDNDPGAPVTIQKHVVVNHAGTIITDEPVDLGEKGFRYLLEDDGLNFMGYAMTVAEYLDTQKQMTVEAGFLDRSDDSFAIYQLKRGDATFDYRFEPMERLTKLGLSVDRANYDLIYVGSLPPARKHNTDKHLYALYEQFNYDHPADFRGHSMSVSDVIALKMNGRVTCHYVDRWGFQELPGFLRPEQSKAQEKRPSVVEQIKQKPVKELRTKAHKPKQKER